MDWTLYREIRVAYADMVESNEDIEFEYGNARIVIGNRVEGSRALPAVELYETGNTEPALKHFIDTDIYTELCDAMEKATLVVSHWFDARKQVL